MKTTSLFLLPFLLLTASATETPQFKLSSVQFVPPPPPGEKPYLREDEESGEPAPQLTIEIMAVVPQRNKEAATPATYDVTFNGKLIAPDKSNLPVDVNAYSEEDGTITIRFECREISKIHPTYTLKGTLEFNTADDEDTKSNEQHHKYSIHQKIHLLGK